MKKLIALALLSAFIAAPALADDTPSGVASDVGAVQKDNQALGSDNSDLAKDRAAKAADKQNGNWGRQAIDSMKIGWDQATGSEKRTEKDTDQHILNSDVNGAAQKTPNE